MTQEALFRFAKRLPFHRFLQQVAIGGILGREGSGPILDAEHHERFRAVVSHRATPGRRDPHDRTLADGKDLAVDLKFTASAQKEIEFFVRLVSVEKSGLRPGCERLERKFAAGRSDDSSAEHLAGNLHGTQVERVIAQFVQFAYAGSAEIRAGNRFFHLFHSFDF